ncbi:hypothetical protein AMTR_s00031p00146520 [Amborella trichopoda]|uniref:Uncharacterized protein n=1 Tax=Amborella trichopoda TaxID=13333 RepID=U5CTH0_AMBTC|nr:hypothetical protein AMTR_s00031p00146520 [Amborella trichopoda]
MVRGGGAWQWCMAMVHGGGVEKARQWYTAVVHESGVGKGFSSGRKLVTRGSARVGSAGLRVAHGRLLLCGCKLVDVRVSHENVDVRVSCERVDLRVSRERVDVKDLHAKGKRVVLRVHSVSEHEGAQQKVGEHAERKDKK